MAFVAPAVRYPDALPSAASWDSLIATLTPGSGPTTDMFVAVVLVGSVMFITLAISRLASGSSSKVTTAPIAARTRGTPNIILSGPSGGGKSALWHALAHGIKAGQDVPATHTSQQLSRSDAIVDSRNIKIVDLPGHARLRHLGDAEVARADAVVFCVDASAARGQGEAMREAADHLHELLTQTTRRKTPLSLLILFTRADLSPLLSVDASDAKRRSAALQRVKLALETELTRRRAGLGIDGVTSTNAAARVGGLRAVAGERVGLFTSLLRALGLQKAPSRTSEEEEDDEAEARDYVEWKAPGSSAQFSLEKLDAHVITAGAAQCALASVGVKRGWKPVVDEGVELKDEKARNESAEWDGLREVRAWCAAV